MMKMAKLSLGQKYPKIRNHQAKLAAMRVRNKVAGNPLGLLTVTPIAVLIRTQAVRDLMMQWIPARLCKMILIPQINKI